jgi:hypothetical protein
MTRRFVIVACLFLGWAAAAHAADPWQEKPHSEWTLEDVQKVMTSSPWVKTVHLDAPWIKGGAHYLYSVPPGCGGRPQFGKPPSNPPQWSGDTTVVMSVVAFTVNWESARTPRAARMRLRTLCAGEEAEEEEDTEFMEEYLEQEQEEYLISVHAPDMQPFDALDEDALLQSTYLLLKKTKQKVTPSRVIIGRGPDRRTVFRLAFFFPKADEAGQPLIAPDEKEVEFVCQGANKVVVKAKFQLPKMVTRDGPDF